MMPCIVVPSSREASMRAALTVLLTMAAAMAASPVAGQDNALRSRLTAVDLKACTQISRHRDGGAWRCRGLPGFPVYVAEGDLRQMLSFGEDAQQRRSATQTLAAFNTIFDGRIRPTIEWRVAKDAKGREQPYATIVRFHTSRDGAKGEVLVITKVDARQSCQLAVVDAAANDNAMAVARNWADRNARIVPCPDKPDVLGKADKSPM